MNTTATTAQASTTAPAGSRRKAGLAGVVVALIAGLFGSAFLAAPANAATSYSTGVYFCTTQSDGGSYAGKPITLMTYNGASWVAYRTGTAGSNGCGTFRNVEAGRSYYVRVSWNTTQPCYYYNTYYSGVSQYWGTVSLNRVLNVGRVSVAVNYYKTC